MFDPVQLRAIADRAVAIRDQARAVRDELDAMLPLAVSDEALAAIADWPKPQRECRKQMLHAVLHLGRASLSLVEAADELGIAVVGVEI